MFAKSKILLLAVILIILGIAFQMSACSAPEANEEPGNSSNYDDYENYENEPVDAGPLEATSLPPTMSPAPTNTLAEMLGPASTATEFVLGMGGSPGEASPTPIVVSMDLNSVFEEVVASLPQGSALFNPPAEMRLGEPHTIEVRIVPVTEEEIEESEALKDALTENLEGEQEVFVIPLRVSTVMKARLTGEAFDILPHMAEEQIRMPDEPYLRWLWEVTPQRTGEQRLTLTLTVVVNAEGVGEKPHVTTEMRKVMVTGNPVYSISNFFGSNWEFVVTGLLFPVLGWSWKKMRDRRKLGR